MPELYGQPRKDELRAEIEELKAELDKVKTELENTESSLHHQKFVNYQLKKKLREAREFLSKALDDETPLSVDEHNALYNAFYAEQEGSR
ncbi:MAG: hypothetical protein WAK69_20715 [Rhodoplanes sp.]